MTGLRPKHRALIYYLAAKHEPLNRTHLLTLFWPDSERASGQQTLRTVLYDLRKVLGSALIVEDDTMALSPEVLTDTWTFKTRLTGSRVEDPEPLNETLALYRGDFLSHFVLQGSPDFDDWCASERESYRALMLRGLICLSSLHESRGEYALALEPLQRALTLDPLQEEIQRECMRLHYLGGDRAAAIRRYDTLRKQL